MKGQMMMIVASVIIAMIVAILLLEIVVKLFLMRSALPTFSWRSKGKGYVAAAKLLLLFNLGAVIFGVLSLGGEGATLLNQVNLYLSMFAYVVELIAVLFYLRAVKRILKDNKVD